MTRMSDLGDDDGGDDRDDRGGEPSLLDQFEALGRALFPWGGDKP